VPDFRVVSRRLLAIAFVLLASAGWIGRATQAERVPPHESFEKFPMSVPGGWRGEEAPGFAASVLAVLGVDEHMNRVYHSPDGAPPVALYVGYYESQRQGDAIHSPLNCLPGAGWQPVSREYLSVPVESGGVKRTIRINRYIVQKGLERHVVLYWYQSHGRVVANEYWSKLFMVYDAVRLNRTDAAMVRILSPVDEKSGGDAQATVRAVVFVQSIFPLLGQHLPS
jgi:EpsI family protein